MNANALDAIDVHELGQRLQSARKQQGLTQEEAANVIGVARTTMTAIESGQRRIKSSELIKLARAYGRQVNDFVRPRPQIEPFTVQFRGPYIRSAEDEKQIAPYVGELEELCRDYLELEQITDSPLNPRYPSEYKITDMDLEQQAKILAEQERGWLGLGDGPIPNLRDILEQEVGLRIFYIEMPSSYSALYLYEDRLGGCIGVNSQHPEERRRWSLAHDYSHFLSSRYRPALHVEDSYKRKPRVERFADYFAEHFLMPTKSLDRQYNYILTKDGTMTPAGLCTLAVYYGVSVAAITLRLEGMKKLPTGTWDKMRASNFKVREAQRHLGISPVSGRDDRLPLRYQFLAVYAFEQGLITEGQFAKFLRVDRMKARQIADETAIDIDMTRPLQ